MPIHNMSFELATSVVRDLKGNMQKEYRLKKLRKNNDYDIWFCKYNNHYYLFAEDITRNYDEDDYDYILLELNYSKKLVAYYNYYEPNCFPREINYGVDYDYECEKENAKESYYIVSEEGAYLMPLPDDRKTDKAILNILRKHYNFTEILKN